jgi:hypothetical protein
MKSFDVVLGIVFFILLDVIFSVIGYELIGQPSHIKGYTFDTSSPRYYQDTLTNLCFGKIPGMVFESHFNVPCTPEVLLKVEEADQRRLNQK